MTDAALEAKFLDLANGVLPSEKSRRVLELCRNMEKLPAASELAQAASV